MIIAPPQTDITLRFLTFDLENDPLLVGEGDCKYDWLDVWDGLPQGEHRQPVGRSAWRLVGRPVGQSLGDSLSFFKCFLPSWITCAQSLKSTFLNSLASEWAPL